jgi:hypothetical protein
LSEPVRPLLRRLFGAAIAVAAAAGAAHAQTCFALQAELMSLQAQGSSGGSGDRARYDSAYREQANVLARTESQARNAGCLGGFFIFRPQPEPICSTLIPRLREMQANLAQLDMLRRQAGGGDNSRRIRELQGMLSDRGCNLPWGSFDTWSSRDAYGYGSPYSGGGTYRTLCVRTCDGYYFPISFSTTQDRFGEDEATCRAMCPSTETRLFHHPNPGGGPENMVAVDGQPYSSLPTAFNYRTSLDPACTCRPAGGLTTAASLAPVPAQSVALPPIAPLPRPRPAPGEDPETLANRIGGFIPGAATATSAATASVATDAMGRPIRVVGPSFLASPEQEALIIAPVPN